MRARLAALSLGILTAMGGMPAFAQEQGEPFAEDLAFPTNFAFAPDGSVYFTEKETGLVRSISPDGELSPEPVVQLHALSGGETGLLGIALHPAFPATRWVYACVTDPPSGMNRLVRFDVQDPEATVEILLETVPGTNTYHNGGDLLFGPDGML